MGRHRRRRRAGDAASWPLPVAAAATAAAITLLVFQSLEAAAVFGAAYVALSVGVTAAASDRRRDLRRSALPLLFIPFIVLALADGVLVSFLRRIIPARYGMGALYLAFWMSLGIVLARIIDRRRRERRAKPGSQTVEVFLTLLGALGGLAVPVAGLVSVMSPHIETSSIYLTDCLGANSVPDGEVLTVTFDEQLPQVASYQSGEAHFDAPEYWGSATAKLDDGSGSSSPLIPFQMNAPAEFLHLGGRVVSMGVLPPPRVWIGVRSEYVCRSTPSPSA